MCSRGVASSEDLLKNQSDQQKSWFKGPRFLWNNTETKENDSKIIEELPDTNKEIKRKSCFYVKWRKPSVWASSKFQSEWN